MFKFFFNTRVNLLKGRVKGHFRKTPTGKIVWVKEHFDNRKKVEENEKAHQKWQDELEKLQDKKEKALSGVDYYSKKYDIINDKHRETINKHKEKKPEKLEGKYIYRDDNEAHVLNKDGEIDVVSLKEYSQINDFDILDALNNPIDYDFNLDLSPKDFYDILKSYKLKDNGYYDWDDAKEIKEKIAKKLEDETGIEFRISQVNEDSIKIVSYGDTAPMGEILQSEAIKNAYREKGESYNEHSTVRGEILLAVENADKYEQLKQNNMLKWDEIKKMMPDNCPDIAGLDNRFKLFSHQALALAKLSKMKESLVDVDMGGGKSLILASDAVIQMSMGNAKKPVICMPSGLIESHVEKIQDYFNGTVGVFVFDSKSSNKKDIKKQLKNLPPNTIILASYSALSNKKGTKDSYPNAEVLSDSGVDMFTLDESHKIKKSSTNANKAITRHFSHCEIKRVASGTLISNNPNDLVGQARFADPSILGSELAFKKKYTEKVKVGGKSTMVWRDGALQQMRKDLINRGMISMRRSDWAYRMPPREEKLHSVDLSPKMKSAYNALLDAILDDPEVKKALEKTAGDRDADLPPNILVKLSHLETLIGSPEITAKDHERLQEYAEKYGDDKMQMLLVAKATARGEQSPKIRKMDEIIDNHFSDKKNKKVIIMCKTYEAQEYILKHMKHSKIAMATTQNNRNADINNFKKSPDKHILVAVRAGLKEGYDINEANRIISYDQEWNSGDMEQSYARIFRPGQKSKVNIDVIAGNNTLEMTKYARTVSKAHANRQVTSDFDDGHKLDEIRMSEYNIKTFNSINKMQPYQDRANSMVESEIEEGKKFIEKYGMKEYAKSGKPLGKKPITKPVEKKSKQQSQKKSISSWHGIIPQSNSSKGAVLENTHGTKFHITGFDSDEGVFTAVKYGDRNKKNAEIFAIDPSHPEDQKGFIIHNPNEDKSIGGSWHTKIDKNNKSQGRVIKNIHGTKFHITGYDKDEGVFTAVKHGDKNKKNAEVFAIDPTHPEDQKGFILHKSTTLVFDLFKSKKKSKFYTPNYVISVVYPPLGRYAYLWPSCARKVFREMGRKSGYKKDMMPHFRAIHRCVMSRPEIKELKKKKDYDAVGINNLKKNPPKGIHPISWEEAIDKVFEDETFITQSELDRKMSGLMSHAFNHAKKYAVK